MSSKSETPLFDHAFKGTRRESWSDKRVKLIGQKARVMELFEQRGELGATIAEVAAVVAAGKSNCVTQVIKDLREAELIRATDQRRAVPGGKLSVVMVCNRMGNDGSSV